MFTIIIVILHYGNKQSSLGKVKKQIEFHTEQDSEITDVHINYQVKPGKKNYLKLNITIDKWDKITE